MKTLGGLAVLVCAGALILDGKCALDAGIQAMELCRRTVIPALFPFLFLSSVLKEQLWGKQSRILAPLCRRLGIPDGGQVLLLNAFLGGYPAGARAVSETFRSGRLTRQEAENLLTFCSNAGPAFLFGMTAVQFSHPAAPWLLWGIQILSALITALLLSQPSRRQITLKGNSLPVADCLNASVRVMAGICGWILVFRVLLGFLDRWFLWLLPEPVQILAAGFLELSIGCVRLGELSSSGVRFVICSAMLSFGGLCVTMQTASAVSGLSLKPYLRGKLVQTALSTALSLALLSPRTGGALLALVLFPFLLKKRCGIPKVSVV